MMRLDDDVAAQVRAAAAADARRRIDAIRTGAEKGSGRVACVRGKNWETAKRRACVKARRGETPDADDNEQCALKGDRCVVARKRARAANDRAEPARGELGPTKTSSQ